jgi:hypothetical protein
MHLSSNSLIGSAREGSSIFKSTATDVVQSSIEIGILYESVVSVLVVWGDFDRCRWSAVKRGHEMIFKMLFAILQCVFKRVK